MRLKDATRGTPDDVREWLAVDGKEFLQRAVDGGDVEAGVDLAGMLSTEDRQKARDLLKQAALAGNERAMANLGLELLKDDNLGDAIKWLEKAAERHNLLAMFNLWVVLKESNQEAANDSSHAPHLVTMM